MRSTTPNDASQPKRHVESHSSRLNGSCKEGLAPDSRRWLHHQDEDSSLSFSKTQSTSNSRFSTAGKTINSLTHWITSRTLTALNDHTAVIKIPKPCTIHLNLVRFKSPSEPKSLSQVVAAPGRSSPLESSTSALTAAAAMRTLHKLVKSLSLPLWL